jgi:hypothetical protein
MRREKVRLSGSQTTPMFGIAARAQHLGRMTRTSLVAAQEFRSSVHTPGGQIFTQCMVSFARNIRTLNRAQRESVTRKFGFANKVVVSKTEEAAVSLYVRPILADNLRAFPEG